MCVYCEKLINYELIPVMAVVIGSKLLFSCVVEVEEVPRILKVILAKLAVSTS